MMFYQHNTYQSVALLETGLSAIERSRLDSFPMDDIRDQLELAGFRIDGLNSIGTRQAGQLEADISEELVLTLFWRTTSHGLQLIHEIRYS